MNDRADMGRSGFAPSLAAWYGAHAGLLAAVILVPVWLRAALHRYHNSDLGYFAQALRSIRWDDLNPYLPARDLRLFGDHFDPILLLLAPLARLMEPVHAALAIEHAFALLAPLPILAVARRNPALAGFGYAATSYLLFNRAILLAIGFPVHPTAWAATFIIALAAGLMLRKTWLQVSAALWLMACKEEFPFAVGALGVGLLFRRDQRRPGTILLALALAWGIAAFALRPVLVGATADHAARILGPLRTEPLETIVARLRSLHYVKPLLQCLIPLSPVILWRIRRRLPPAWPFLLALAPLLGIRLVGDAWGLHYMPPVAALLAAALLGPDLAGFPRKYAFAVGALALLVSMGPITKGFAEYRSFGELASPRMAAIADARRLLLAEPGGAALIHGNLGPTLSSRPNVFAIGGWQEASAPPIRYRFFLAETPPHGNPWPRTHADVSALIAAWRADSAVKVLRDDSLVFFAERLGADRAWDPGKARGESR
ncbi:MAG TPA: DUF2079 domain-containing protein [Candidatus Eisenbacteria bacterium]|nr:DUF2079 domain-containing protein [Candidatus Eisenbacteria bacterium]